MARKLAKAEQLLENAPAGCVVVLEPGAKWPETAFASIDDREGVAVVHVTPGEPPEHFFKRLTRQFAHVAANGVLIGTVLVACAAPRGASINRRQLADHVQEQALFAPNGAVIFVDGDSNA